MFLNPKSAIIILIAAWFSFAMTSSAEAQYTKKNVTTEWSNPNATDTLQVVMEYGYFSYAFDPITGQLIQVFVVEGTVGPQAASPVYLQMPVMYSGKYTSTVKVPSAQNRWCRARWERIVNGNPVVLGRTTFVLTVPADTN